MKFRFYRPLLGACLAGALFLSGCLKSAVQTPTPSLPASEIPATLIQKSLPAEVAVTKETEQLAHPEPGGPGQSPDTAGTAKLYPDPSLGSPASQAGPYPGPGAATPAVGNAYPGPGEIPTEASSQEQPTPAETPDLLNTATRPAQEDFEQTIPTATGIPGTPRGPVVLTPGFPVLTPTSTPFLVRPTLAATDPRSVILASGQVQLVEFFAFWSISSRSMAPVVHVLEEKYKDELNFIYLDVDDPDTRQFQLDLGYQLIPDPHFYLVDGGGNVLQEWTGYVSEQEFEEAFSAALGR